MAASTTQLMDFTLVFAEADKAWAEWIVWVLELVGYTVTINQIDLIAENYQFNSHQIIVLLPLESASGQELKQLIRRFVKTRNSEQEPRAIIIRLEKSRQIELTSGVGPLDLMGVDRQEAHRRLLSMAKSMPLPFNPPLQPPFRKSQPPFPGEPLRGTPRKAQGIAQGYIEKLTNAVQIEMMQIPGGMFTMGASETEEGSPGSERPTRRVNVPPFCMGRYAVTQAQWRFVEGLPQISCELAPDPARFNGDDKPVEFISWLEATEFCARLSQYTEREYRLPTEAEWEYACRGKTKTPFHFGEIIDPEVANYDANKVYGQGRKGLYREATTPVGSFKVANAFGLYDMHGNVWEWCMDHWHESYEGAPSDGTAWIDPKAKEDARRVLRGGSWRYSPTSCRSASRLRVIADYRDSYIGFRLVSPARISP
jgi:formylglycine-generating enzyme required for sulfatase activity